MKKIAVKRMDGGVTILIPANDATPELLLRDALNTEGYVSHREIDDSDIPESRYFRNAWTDDNPTSTIDVDLDKAKEIKLDKFREIRKPLLNDLDVDYLKALEKGEDLIAISARKQALRDITDIELPSNIDELEAFMPTELRDIE